MANIIDGICPEGSILDGFDDWPRSATRKEWFRITHELVASTIADMDLAPHELAQVEEAFVGECSHDHDRDDHSATDEGNARMTLHERQV